MRINFFGIVVLTFGFMNCASACDKWEYAKLKDATKKELIDEYCYSSSIADIQKNKVKNMRELESLGSKSRADVKEAEEEQYSCLRQVDETAAMLKKKFKATPPVKCPT